MIQNKTTTEEKAGTGGAFHRENFRRRTRYISVFIVMVILLIVVVVLNVNLGSVGISPGEIFRIIFTHSGDDPKNVDIIWELRLPRILMGAILGGGLSLAGFLLQTYFENPIAGPFVLGISSGSKMIVAITMIVFLSRFSHVSSWTLVIAAFIGALISTAFILLISRRVTHMASLLVAGIMIGYICSAITDFIVTFADDSDIVNLRDWSLGSFSGSSWGNVGVAAVVIGLSFVMVLLLSKPIGAFQLGEAYAQSMGVNVRRFRVAIILLSSLLSGCVTAFAGPISFVGIAVPFLVKMSLKTARPLIVIPATFLGGGVFCMWCDLIARMSFAPMELNISTVTAMFGAPVVIFMMIRKRRWGA